MKEKFASERNVLLKIMTIVVDLMPNSMTSIEYICGQIIPESI
jgi:hypothetical protein